MCLSVVYRGKEKREALAKLPDSFYVWKVIKKYGKRYETAFGRQFLHGGEVLFRANMIDADYRGGGHFWREENAANCQANWDSGRIVVRCRAKKSDITSIGTQSYGKVIVLKRAIFPKWVGKAQ